MKGKVIFGGVIVMAFVVGVGMNYVNIRNLPFFNHEAVAKKVGSTTPAIKHTPTTHLQKPTADNVPPAVPAVIDGVKMRYNPFKPSGGAYPRLKNGEQIWIDVSVSQQLVYIFNGSRRIYTMATSSGLDTIPDNSTPLGVYHIQAERGTWFYTQQYQEGAEYWVSWLGHGVFLFHSVPMNQKHQLIPKVAAMLLHKASHGCFHLTIPDSQWIYDHVPYGTTVVVEQAPVYLMGNQLYHPTHAQIQATLATQPAKA
jgi:lipoprotein-anchoring transpeptidase ErfK/SrfK